MKKTFETKVLAEIGILIGAAVVIDLLAGLYSPFRYGGSISPAMLFIFVIAFRHGTKAGILAGVAFGLISSLVGWPLGITYVVHPIQYALDYLVAFGVLGLAGLFKKGTTKALPFILGITVGSFLRYLAHGFSGIIFFASYAIELGHEVWLYSFVLYNLPYMAASYGMCVVLGLILQRRNIFTINLKQEEE
ncbi:MAG: energy-coupled thiamine transporter ThiT [Tenericutes bacterium HGW-Tenericutes-1]|jgi:thiamine transporter|nr:MAG: energy-coupled thiamine transporter ThiT [Tenericutes bacterium HGW-Tenericutes-1]